jgi:hypothetical protein
MPFQFWKCAESFIFQRFVASLQRMQADWWAKNAQIKMPTLPRNKVKESLQCFEKNTKFRAFV